MREPLEINFLLYNLLSGELGAVGSGGYFRQAALRIHGPRMCWFGLLLWKDAPCLPAVHFLPPLRGKGAAWGLPCLAPTHLL